MSEWDARGHTPHTRVRGTPIAYIIPGKDEWHCYLQACATTHMMCTKWEKAMTQSNREQQKQQNCFRLSSGPQHARHGLLLPFPRQDAGDATASCQLQRQPRHGDGPGPAEQEGREDCMTKKSEKEVSTETDAFMRTV